MSRKVSSRTAVPPLPLFLGLLFIAGCRSNSQPETPTPPPRQRPIAYTPTPPKDPWIIETTSWDGDYRGTYLGNGYLGQRMVQTGTGTGPHGALPAYAAGLYEQEHLAAIPSPTALEIRVNGRVFGADAAAVKDYRQSLDMRRGLLRTEATWDTGQGAIRLTIDGFLARQQPELACLRIALKPERDVTVSFVRPAVVETGDFGAPATSDAEGRGRRIVARTRSGKAVVVQEDRIQLSGAATGPTTAGGELVVAVEGGQEAVLTRVTATAWAGSESQASVRVEWALAAAREWEPVLARHTAAWGRLWEGDIGIEGSPVEQQIVRSWMFYLLQSVRAGSADSIPPMGLSEAAFSGHVFWDAETWMFPALVLQHPEMAKSMLEYRYRTLPGAMANAKAEGKRGAAYAWESAATGREQTPPGPTSRFGRHVNGDIALAFWQYWLATGDRKWLAARAWPVLSATADYWVSRVTLEPGGGYGIRHVATPDENAGVVDNSAWTNFIARKNLEFAADAAGILGRRPKADWRKVAAGLKLPRDPATGLLLEHAGYKGTKIKQTDTLLLIYPGQMTLSDVEKGKLYDFYAPKTIPVGPAMSDSIHAIVAAELGRGAEAYRHFQESYRPFLRPPFLYFSEKRTRDNLYFHTGAGGDLQSVLYGFAGLRFQDRDAPAVEHPLLPDAWQSLEIRHLHWRGRAWNLRLEKGKPPSLTPAKGR